MARNPALSIVVPKRFFRQDFGVQGSGRIRRSVVDFTLVLSRLGFCCMPGVPCVEHDGCLGYVETCMSLFRPHTVTQKVKVLNLIKQC